MTPTFLRSPRTQRGFKNIGRAVYASSKSSSRTTDQIRKIKEILDRAASEIGAV